MRNIQLKDISWKATIEYMDHPDSELVFAKIDAITMLDAVVHIQNHHNRNIQPSRYNIVKLEEIHTPIG